MIAFVILHYKNMNDTFECIDSIKKLTGNKKIIVVDNNSLTKENAEVLKKEVDDIILLEENLGFAKANNKGINFAKEKYNPDFIAVLNNDIVIDDIEFIKKIESDYKEYKFDMIGPKINTEGDSYNPFPVLKNKSEVENEIKRCNKLIKTYSSTVMYELLKIYLKIKHFINKPVKPDNGKVLEKNIALHGCAIIFSKKYLEKYEYAFYNETFLYHEEEFLYQRVIKDKLVSVYDPNLELYHKEGSSLNTKIKNERQRKLFKEKTRLESLKKLLSIM